MRATMSGTELLHHAFERTAERLPHKHALVCGDQRFTYADIDRRSRQLACALAENGVGHGDRIGLLLDNGPEMVTGLFAVLRLGAVSMTINPSTKADKLGHILGSTQASALLTHDALAQTWRGTAKLPVVVAGTGPVPLQAGELDWPVDDGSWPVLPPVGLSTRDDLAFISHTSGTTGQPKGVMLSHRNLASVTATIREYLDLTEGDIIASALPLSFNYGLTQLLMAFATGATLVLERNFAFPVKMLDLMVRERATVFPAVPTMYAMLARLQDLPAWDLSSLRILTSASAPLSTELAAILRQRLPQARLYVMYGQTECTRISYLPPEQLDSHAGSVGRGMPGQQCWLADENGQRLPPGSTGELVVQGDHVMRGYWNDPAATARKIGFDPGSSTPIMHTGDLFRSDKEGWLYFVARMDDIIKTRGEKVSPLEVERAINAIPGVVESKVVGIPDELLGQAVKAYVVLDEDTRISERDVVRHCLSRLENHMVPKSVAFVDALPRTDTGKIRNPELH